LAAAKLNKMMF